MGARGLIKNLELHYLAVMLLGCGIAGNPTQTTKSERIKSHAPVYMLPKCRTLNFVVTALSLDAFKMAVESLPAYQA